MLEVAVKLFAVALVMAGGLLAVARASRGGRAGSSIRVSGRHGLAKGAVVAVVEVDGRRFLVGAGDHQVSMLTELAPVDEVLEVQDLEDAPTGIVRARTTTARLAAAIVAANQHARRPHRMGSAQHSGPRIGPLDRLRALTVRSAPLLGVGQGESAGAPRGLERPIHVTEPPA